jgi:hypothetical protein
MDGVIGKAPGKIMIRNLFTDPPWIAGEGIICNDRNILLGNLISGHETIVKPFL